MSLSVYPYLLLFYRGTQLLGREDPDAINIVANAFEKDGVKVLYKVVCNAVIVRGMIPFHSYTTTTTTPPPPR